MRRRHPVFRRRGWYQGRPIYGSGVGDLGWFKPDGQVMGEEDWQAGFAKALGVFLNGENLPSIDPKGEPLTDDSFLILFNADRDRMDFRLPPAGAWGSRWLRVLDTNDPGDGEEPFEAGAAVPMEGLSTVVLRRAG
jgi:glycogen operon protein